MSDKQIPERWREKYAEIGPDGDGAEKHLRAAIEQLGAAEAERDALREQYSKLMDAFHGALAYRATSEGLQAKNRKLVQALEGAKKIMCILCSNNVSVKLLPGGWFHDEGDLKSEWYSSFPYRCEASFVQAVLADAALKAHAEVAPK
jgi:hypothetical protein